MKKQIMILLVACQLFGGVVICMERKEVPEIVSDKRENSKKRKVGYVTTDDRCVCPNIIEEICELTTEKTEKLEDGVLKKLCKRHLPKEFGTCGGMMITKTLEDHLLVYVETKVLGFLYSKLGGEDRVALAEDFKLEAGKVLCGDKLDELKSKMEKIELCYVKEFAVIGFNVNQAYKKVSDELGIQLKNENKLRLIGDVERTIRKSIYKEFFGDMCDKMLDLQHVSVEVAGMMVDKLRMGNKLRDDIQSVLKEMGIANKPLLKKAFESMVENIVQRFLEKYRSRLDPLLFLQQTFSRMMPTLKYDRN